MKNNKNKTSKNATNQQQKSNDAVNVNAPNVFDLETNSLDHEIKPEEIGFDMKR